MLSCNQLTVSKYELLSEGSLLHTMEIIVSQDDVDQFANLVDDHNWIHKLTLDNPKPIVHGALIVSKCTKIITFCNTYKVLHLGYDLVRFYKPVYAGETLESAYIHKGITFIDDEMYQTILECIVRRPSTREVLCKMIFRGQHFLKKET